MSTQLQEKDGVYVTRYARGQGKGFGYQVTWRSDETHLPVWVCVESEQDAFTFANIIRNSIKR